MYSADPSACHRCGNRPLYQWSRAATAAEAGERKAEIALLQGRLLTDTEIAERYGPLRVAVTGCAEHHLGDDPAGADSGLDRRALMHAAECAGHGGCACDGALGLIS